VDWSDVRWQGSDYVADSDRRQHEQDGERRQCEPKRAAAQNESDQPEAQRE